MSDHGASHGGSHGAKPKDLGGMAQGCLFVATLMLIGMGGCLAAIKGTARQVAGAGITPQSLQWRPSTYRPGSSFTDQRVIIELKCGDGYQRIPYANEVVLILPEKIAGQEACESNWVIRPPGTQRFWTIVPGDMQMNFAFMDGNETGWRPVDPIHDPAFNKVKAMRFKNTYGLKDEQREVRLLLND